MLEVRNLNQLHGQQLITVCSCLGSESVEQLCAAGWQHLHVAVAS